MGKNGATSEVEAYIEGCDPPVREIVEGLRDLVLDVAPDLKESVKWGQPCYAGRGNVCYISADRDHAKLGFFQGGLLPDPQGRLEGTGAKMRHVKVRASGEIDGALRVLVREAVVRDAEERRGGA